LTIAAQPLVLKVVDAHGLVRTESTVKGVVAVEVSINSQSPTPRVTISNIDGFHTEKEPSSVNSDKYLFESVSPGTWKILGSNFTVTSVKIVTK